MRKIPRLLSERLIAAADPIADRGLNATKIEDIVAATGIPRATLYYYFDGKESILAFLLDDVLRQVADEVGAAASADGTGAQRLNGVIAAQLRVMGRRPVVCRALLGELSRAGRMPVISEMLSRAYVQPVESVLLDGVADGSIGHQRDARAAAVALLGAVTAIAITYLVADEELDQRVVTATVASVILDGLHPR